MLVWCNGIELFSVIIIMSTESHHKDSETKCVSHSFDHLATKNDKKSNSKKKKRYGRIW